MALLTPSSLRLSEDAMRCVRGSFFADYVKMLRRRKSPKLDRFLDAHDITYLHQRINPDDWYPMDVFERLGVAILQTVDGASLAGVQLWGRFSANQFAQAHPQLVAPNEPVETLMRLRVLRRTLFNFHAFDIPMLVEGTAHVDMTYLMGAVAEEAACFQTMGFCEGVLSLANARNVKADFMERAWVGDERSRLIIEWDPPEQ